MPHRRWFALPAALALGVGILIVAPSPGGAANGTFTIAPVPNPTGGADSDLKAVSCTSTSWCMSVSGNMFAHWNGASWTSDLAPTTAEFLSLDSVSCTSPSFCVAVGYESSSTFTPSPTTAAAFQWDGASWTSSAVVSPAGNFQVNLNGVSCTSATICVAVGYQAPSGDESRLLAETWDGSAWSESNVVPNPSDSGSLNAVSCTGPATCMAVGADASSPGSALAYGFFAGAWTELPTPPAGAVLNGVSCIGITCEAVGNNGNTLVADRWNGSTWSGQSTANPAGTDRFLSVSCASLTACTAVGTKNPSTTPRPLIERYDGSTWSILSNPAAGLISDFASVSCVAAAACVAVGGASDVNGARFPLVETSNQTQTAHVTTITATTSKTYVLAGDAETFTAKVNSTNGVGSVSFLLDPFQPNPSFIPGCTAVPLAKVGTAWEATCTTTSVSPGYSGASVAIYTGGGLYLPSSGAPRILVLDPQQAYPSFLRSAAAFKYVSTPIFQNSTRWKWSLVHGSLPVGMTLSTGGSLAGTPTTPGSYAFYAYGVPTSTSYGAGLILASITVTPLTIAPVPPVTSLVDHAVSIHLTATGGKSTLTYSVAAGSLPPGLKLATNGVLSGAITVPGSYSFTVGVHDSLTPVPQTATTPIHITVQPMDVVCCSANATVGKSYTGHMSAVGGKAPYKFVFVSGSFPPGLKLGTNGYFSGTPTVAGSFIFTVEATDSGNPQNSVTGTIYFTVLNG